MDNSNTNRDNPPEKKHVIAIETEKNVYYPGEMVKGAIYLKVYEEVNRIDRLALIVYGKEYFKFLSSDKKIKSLKSSREIVNDRIILCNFIPQKLTA